jgi:hypothetical protein
MGVFDIFRNKWSAGAMTEVDRQKIFWLLKRRTSYTAWKREADAFDAFAAIVEKQLKEQPHAPGWGNGTDWHDYYIEVVKGQVFYEQGLARLKQGDRTVWLCNSLGALDKARTISNRWYVDLVNHGIWGDTSFDGKYVPAMTEAMKVVRACSAEAGYTQPNIPPQLYSAPETFDTERFATLRLPRPPNPLPEVPVPTGKPVLINNGNMVPVFGIYEPQVEDGCMNYLLGGAPAPRHNYSYWSFKWRLIWQDDRYRDGFVPLEEAFYFPPPAPTPDAPQAPASTDKPAQCQHRPALPQRRSVGRDE